MRVSSFVSASAVLVASLYLQACAGCRDVDCEKEPDHPSCENATLAPTPTAVLIGERGYWVSMAVTDTGPALAYFWRNTVGQNPDTRPTDKGSLRVDRWDPQAPGGWKTEKVHGFPKKDGDLLVDEGNSGRYVDMVATGDRLWVAHYGGEEPNDLPRWLRLSYFDGTEWIYVGDADMAGSATDDLGKNPAIAVDNNELPAVAYYDVKNKRLKVAWADANLAWNNQVVDEGTQLPDGTGTQDVGSMSDILYFNNAWWIAYRDELNKDLKVAHGSPGNWTIETVAGTDTDEGLWPTLFNDNGTLLLAWQDVTNQDLKLGTYTGSGWDIVTVDNGDLVGAESNILRSGNKLAIYYFEGAHASIKQAVRVDGSPDWAVSNTVIGGTDAVGFSSSFGVWNGQIVYATYGMTSQQLVYGTLPLP